MRGSIHPTAVIGEAPESRDWLEGEDAPVLTPLLHSSARVNAFVTIDGGLIRRTEVGAGSLVMAHAHLGHDVVVGKDVEVSTGAVIGGGCSIGNGARIGIGAVIRPRQVIGAGAQVGAGAVVTKDVPPGITVVGNPARPL